VALQLATEPAGEHRQGFQWRTGCQAFLLLSNRLHYLLSSGATLRPLSSSASERFTTPTLAALSTLRARNQLKSYLGFFKHPQPYKMTQILHPSIPNKFQIGFTAAVTIEGGCGVLIFATVLEKSKKKKNEKCVENVQPKMCRFEETGVYLSWSV
jgi:hypothetical protein